MYIHPTKYIQTAPKAPLIQQQYTYCCIMTPFPSHPEAYFCPTREKSQQETSRQQKRKHDEYLTSTCLRVCARVCVHISTHVGTFTCVCVCVCVCMCLCACAYTCICVCVFCSYIISSILYNKNLWVVLCVGLCVLVCACLCAWTGICVRECVCICVCCYYIMSFL